MSIKDKFFYFMQKIFRNNLNLKSIVVFIFLTSLISSLIAGGLLSLNHTLNLKKQLSGFEKQSFFKAGFINNITSVAQIAKKTGPAIVGIRMVVQTSFSKFFNSATENSTTEGSGIIIHKDGYIMTNYHVVQYADPRNTNRQKGTLEVFLPR